MGLLSFHERYPYESGTKTVRQQLNDELTDGKSLHRAAKFVAILH